MKKFILTFLICFISIFGYSQTKFNVILSEYTLSNDNEYMHFEIQNIFNYPIYVTYIKIIDTSKNITFYYSDDLLIINNYNGFANLYSDIHHIKIIKNIKR